MKYYDVFNGDADGICALQQLRLDEPVASVLVTGVKRDIALLERVAADPGDRVTVLDVSLDSNRKGLEALLSRGAQVLYFDHHFAGDIPDDPKLTATIDTSPKTCTSLLVNKHLQGKHLPWAVVGAFGDNFDESARQAAASLHLNEDRFNQLRELGILINYNAYGRSVDDLHIAPDELLTRLRSYSDPFAFIAENTTFALLRDGYEGDMRNAQAIAPDRASEKSAVYVLPSAAWANRVSGVFANQLARQAPNRAHALLTTLIDGGYLVSVRAPVNDPQGADTLCRQFPTGGGRKAAAGINRLQENALQEFITQFEAAYQ